VTVNQHTKQQRIWQFQEHLWRSWSTDHLSSITLLPHYHDSRMEVCPRQISSRTICDVQRWATYHLYSESQHSSWTYALALLVLASCHFTCVENILRDQFTNCTLLTDTMSWAVNFHSNLFSSLAAVGGGVCSGSHYFTFNPLKTKLV
jgi:hypothetical protein